MPNLRFLTLIFFLLQVLHPLDRGMPTILMLHLDSAEEIGKLGISELNYVGELYSPDLMRNSSST